MVVSTMVVCEKHPTKEEEVVVESCDCADQGGKPDWLCWVASLVPEDMYCCDGWNGETFKNGKCVPPKGICEVGDHKVVSTMVLCEGHPTKEEEVVIESCDCAKRGGQVDWQCMAALVDVDENTYCCGGDDGATFEVGTTFENGTCVGKTCQVGEFKDVSTVVVCEGHPTREEVMAMESCTCVVVGFHKLDWLCWVADPVHEDMYCCGEETGATFENGACIVAPENRCPSQRIWKRGFRAVLPECGGVPEQ
jgi:hypothetical protein